ncbi:MAG: hypothetical protein KAR31_12595 [Candidatus Omnitrophica bacterium]|nr:hypothetical protein [Candidatus Omnitrophota bacterium]
MTNSGPQKKEDKKGFFGRLMEKLDKKLKDASEQKECCCSSNDEKDSSCC